jgi:heme-degrading monooxygenase HmoA
MFARMTTFQIKPEFLQDAIGLFRRNVIPSARKQKGFRGACLLMDRPAGKGISVTFWRTEKDAQANEENRYYQEQLVKFLTFFAAPPIREGFAVEIHGLETPGALRSAKKAAKGTKPAPRKRSK